MNEAGEGKNPVSVRLKASIVYRIAAHPTSLTQFRFSVYAFSGNCLHSFDVCVDEGVVVIVVLAHRVAICWVRM